MTALFLASCDREGRQEARDLAPAAESDLSRTLLYENGTVQGVVYPANVIQASSFSNTEGLTFYAGVDAPNGNDHISFRVAPEKLRAGYIGTYTFKSVANAGSGDAVVRYSHATSATSSAIFDSSFSRIEGSYEIRQYDARHKLISGIYQVVIPQALDPYRGTTTQGNPGKVDITVTGTFRNVAVQ
jgi:hypothetical protein